MVKVAINGFGRIGRLAFRQMFGAEGYEVVAINDLTSPAMLAHLLKYDTAQGSYCGHIGENLHTVESTEDSIIVDGKEIKIYAEKDAANCPWGQLDVDVVLECTGFYTSKDKSAGSHLNAGAKKVVISAPAGKDLPTIVYSVNEKTLTKEDKIISAASCTTNCLAPMAKALNDKYPIVERHHDHRSRLHRRPDDPGRPPPQGRPASCPCRRSEHRAQLHRRCQGHRPGHPRAERQADRLRPARARVHRFYHHSGGGCEGLRT